MDSGESMRRVALISGVLLAAAWAIGACSGDGSEGSDQAGLDAGADRDSAADAPLVPPDQPTPDGSPPPRCTRDLAARGAPVALFDRLEHDIQSAQTAGDRKALADRFVRDVQENGGAPLEDPDSDRVVFIARGEPGPAGWNVAGSWINWDVAQRANLKRIVDTDLFAVELMIDRRVAHAYKLLIGDTSDGFREDPLASHVVWDGIVRPGIGEFNGVVHPAALDSSKGRLVRWGGVQATKLANARDVFVYLPAAYDDATCPVLPVNIFHDGNEAITRGHFDIEADTLFAAKPELAQILIFVALPSQDVRMAEYTFGTMGALGDDYGAFLADDLLPRLESKLRVCRNPADRALSGESLGGLISTYLAFQRPDVWGFVGAQSSSYFWNSDWMIQRAGADPVVPVRLYVDHGCPNDNCDENRRFVAAVQSKGYEIQHVEAPNAAHDWPDWRARVPAIYTTFRSGRSGCTMMP